MGIPKKTQQKMDNRAKPGISVLPDSLPLDSSNRTREDTNGI
jgi:hypothetical protein